MDTRKMMSKKTELLKKFDEPINVLDKGFVRLVDVMGDDQSIVDAARVSYAKGTKSTRSNRGLIRYLMRQGHMNPFEMCEIKVHIKAPIFVSRQIVRHRTANINEMSARYSEVPEEYYLPDESRMNPQGGNSTQSSAEDQTVEKPLELRYGMDAILQDSFTTYSSLIDRGLARELARAVTPLGTYTQWYWKIDLRNLLHFIHLRADEHAQWEVRQYANVLADIVKVWVPDAWEAFKDYVLDSVTLSGPEVKEAQRAVLFAILSEGSGGLDKLSPDEVDFLNVVDGKLTRPPTMSKGECKEYAEKLDKVSMLAYDLWYCNH